MVSRWDWRGRPWDRRGFAAALGASLVFFAVGCALTGATDEGGVSWTVRVARTLAAAPLCGATTVFLLLRRAAQRGELLALEALGWSRARSAAFMVAGAVTLSAAAAGRVATSPDAAALFFPTPPAIARLRWDGDAFVDDARHVRVLPTGELAWARLDERPGRAEPHASRELSAAVVVLAFGVALALLAAHEITWRVVTVTGAMIVLDVVALQAAAAGRLHAPVACLPPLALLGLALRRVTS